MIRKFRAPRTLQLMKEDLETAKRRDPAATNTLEVALAYPGVHALWGYRASNALWRKGLRTPARLVQELTRFATGVDIHPEAKLGRRLFIDHATAVVIGQTAVVGDDVLIYHEVTLGGVTMSPGKRHPTVGDSVTIGAGAKVLGPITVGDGASIGANAVVIQDVPAQTVAVGVPSRVIHIDKPVERSLMNEPALYI